MRELSYKDVDLTHRWATQYRIPVIHNLRPDASYFIALATTPPVNEDNLFNIAEPTDEEAAIVASYLEFVVNEKFNYFPHYRAQIREHKLDADEMIATVTLVKRLNYGWGYSKSTWDSLSPWPFLNSDIGPIGLVAVLDHLEQGFNDQPITAKWSAWKEDHSIG
jgi:hypothetical protein